MDWHKVQQLMHLGLHLLEALGGCSLIANVAPIVDATLGQIF